MPTIHYELGFRFFFYSNEGEEPPHVHIEKGDAYGKVWLHPEVEIAYLHQFSPNEERQIQRIISDNLDNFVNKWYAFFGSSI